MRLLLVSLVFGLVGAVATAKDDAARDEMKKLEGTWTIVSFERDGTKAQDDVFKDMKIIVKGDHYTVKRGNDVVDEGTFVVRPDKNPKEMDTMPTSGEHKGETLKSIYELNGDTFRECQADPGKDRPKEFSAKAGTGYTLSVMKRQKD